MNPTGARDVVDQAIAWLLLFETHGTVATSHPDFQHWLHADPQHATVWEQLRAVDQRFSSLGPRAGRALRKRAPARQWRKQVAACVLLALTVVCAGAVADRYSPVAGLVADYSTRTGERRQVILPDGTMLTLDARTVVDVAFDEKTRTLKLRQGEVAIETAHDVHRPFVVQTSQTRVRALGTYFTVASDTTHTEVTVIRSAVAVKTGVGEQVFEAGQKAVVDNDGQLVWHGNAPAQPDAWTTGMLTADRLAMSEFVRKLGAYRSGVVTVDPAVSRVPVSGTFSMADPDLALAAVAQVTPVRIERVAPGWIRVVPKK